MSIKNNGPEPYFLKMFRQNRKEIFAQTEYAIDGEKLAHSVKSLNCLT